MKEVREVILADSIGAAMSFTAQNEQDSVGFWGDGNTRFRNFGSFQVQIPDSINFAINCNFSNAGTVEFTGNQFTMIGGTARHSGKFVVVGIY